MNTQNATMLELQTMRQQLARFSCLQEAPLLTETDASKVRETLLAFNDASDYQTLGVCADDVVTARLAVETYVAALNRSIQLDLEPRPGPVYLKFNTLNGAWYLDDYPGSSRGVLVSFHASEPAATMINGTYGPLPLTLFVEA